MYAMGYTSERKADGKGRLVGLWYELPELGEFEEAIWIGIEGLLTAGTGLQICAGLTGWSMLSGQ